jgi:PAS domain S-box-containing protein
MTKAAAGSKQGGKLTLESQGEDSQIQGTTPLRLTLRSFLGPRREARLNALLLALGLVLFAAGAFPLPQYVSGLATYLPLHTAMEMFTIVVAALVFAVGWNSYSRERARNVVLLSCVFLGVALLDLAHTLSFPGMPDFVTPGDPEKAIHFWLAARLCAALGLLAAALLPWRPFESERTRFRLLTAVLGATALAYWIGLNYPQLLPRTFVPGTGLTGFKIGAEYALGATYLAAAILFYARMRSPRHAFLHYLFAASVVSVYSELFMTVFADITDIHNLFGHAYKVIAYYLIYRAVLIFGVDEPYQRLHAAQTELLESNQRLQDLTKLSSDWLWEQDAELRFTPTTIDMASKIFLDPGGHIGKKRWELPHEDISAEAWRQHQALLDAHQSFYEFVIPRRNTAGGVEYLSISGMPKFDASGAFQGYRGVGKNISERKRSELELRKLSLALEHSPFSVLITDRAGRIEYVNPHFNEQTGYSAEESIGQTPSLLKSGRMPPETYRDLWATISSGQVWHGELLNRAKNGNLIWEKTSITPLKNERGEIIHYVAVKEDITEHKRAAEALRASEERLRELNAELEQRVVERTQQLEAANRELEVFSYSVSHDLRAPLRAIEGFSRLLLTEHADKLDAGGQDYLQRIRRASLRLGELIDDLLKLAHVTRGGVRRERVDLSRMAEDILADLCATAPERKIETAVEEGIVVEGDSRLLRVALENLLGNAWKFTSRTTLASIRFGQTPAQGVTEIYVRDNGVGFDPKYAGRLFGAFQRLHTEQEFSGTGIGLATVQRVVQAHGGQIRAEAQPGAGATFYFTVGASSLAQDRR